MTTQGFIRWMIQTLIEDMEKLSASIATSGMDQHDYLISVGKYRQMKSTVEKLRERLANTESLPGETDEFGPEVPAEPTSVAEVQPKRSSPRTSKPRAWGGGR